MFLQKLLIFAVVLSTHNIVHQVNGAAIKESTEITDCENSAHINLCASMLKDHEEFPVARINKFKLISAKAINHTRSLQSDEDAFCATDTYLISPISGVVRNNDYDHIVLVGNSARFEQLVKVEVCRESSASCEIPGTIDAGKSYKCVQHYTQRYLEGIVSGNLTPPTIPLFALPSGCNCAPLK